MNENFVDKLWIPFNNSSEYIKLYEESLKKANNGRHDNFRKRYRFFSLYQLVSMSLKNNSNFHFAECGCFKGQSTYIISSLLKKHQFKNKFFIFDSFEDGLSSFTHKDKTLKNQNLTQDEEYTRRNKFANSFNNFLDLIEPFNFVTTYKGWIPEKFYHTSDYQFQFVHIDVDLYQPTYDSLDFFFPRLVKGGVIVCDDYNFSNFPGAKLAWDEYFKDKDIAFSYEVPLGSKFLIK